MLVTPLREYVDQFDARADAVKHLGIKQASFYNYMNQPDRYAVLEDMSGDFAVIEFKKPFKNKLDQ